MIVENFIAFMQKLLFFTSYVNNNSSFPKPLTPKEEVELLEKYRNGDNSAKEKLVQHNLRLVAHIVKKYNQAGEAEDFIGVGSLGLIKAIETYKSNVGTQFSTYAARCIENEILMLIRLNKKHKNTISLEDVLCADDEDNEISVVDLAHEEENDVALITENNILKEKLSKILIENLTKRENTIICMRYGLNNMPMLTQREVAKKLGISRSYISRLEKKALETLKSKMNKSDYF